MNAQATDSYTETLRTPVEGRWDVLVAGAGAAGLCAAIAAARAGAKTLLLDPSGSPGGTASLGLPWAQFNDGKDRQIIRGLADEFLTRLKARGAVSRDPARDRFVDVDNELYKVVALEMLLEAGVEPRLHSLAVRALMAGARVEALVVEGKGGRRALRAGVFVDATGDGDLAALAGAPIETGRRRDGLMQPLTLLFTVAHADDARFLAWGGNEQLIAAWRAFAPGAGLRNPLKDAQHLAHLTQVRNRTGEWYLNVTRVLGADGTSAAGLTRAELEGRLQAIEFVERFLRPRVPGFERCYIGAFAPRIGVRETRHVLGDYVLSGEDVLAFRKFEDAIACCAYPTDIHDPTGAGGGWHVRGGIEHFEAHAGEFYQIPYRCLLPRGVENLLVAGRCISATHEAAASFRVIAPCMAMGQAAGCAAALSVKRGLSPRQVPAADVRQALLENGAFLDEVSVAERGADYVR